MKILFSSNAAMVNSWKHCFSSNGAVVNYWKRGFSSSVAVVSSWKHCFSSNIEVDHSGKHCFSWNVEVDHSGKHCFSSNVAVVNCWQYRFLTVLTFRHDRFWIYSRFGVCRQRLALSLLKKHCFFFECNSSGYWFGQWMNCVISGTVSRLICNYFQIKTFFQPPTWASLI